MSKLNNTCDDSPANTGNDIQSHLKMSSLVPSQLIPAILNADPMLAADVKNRADADEERRIERLRENGAQGGRPRIERTLLAQQCVEAEFAKHGQLLLRYYRGGWYRYVDGSFSLIPEKDVRMEVSGWLINSGAADVSVSLLNDIIVNMQSNALCGLPQGKYTMPCFISTGSPTNVKWLFSANSPSSPTALPAQLKEPNHPRQRPLMSRIRILLKMASTSG